MKRACLAAVASLALATVAWADDSRYVYEIRDLGTAGTDPWSINMGVIAEAARLYAPATFARSGGGVSLTLEASMSFSLGRSVDVERSDKRILVRHEVTVQGVQSLPKAEKRYTIRFSLSDIVKKGGAYAGSPLMYALRKAISISPYPSGRAWIESARYDGAGRFVIVVGLSKR